MIKGSANGSKTNSQAASASTIYFSINQLFLFNILFVIKILEPTEPTP
jgi:hypothetical protein